MGTKIRLFVIDKLVDVNQHLLDAFARYDDLLDRHLVNEALQASEEMQRARAQVGYGICSYLSFPMECLIWYFGKAVGGVVFRERPRLVTL